MGRGVWALGAMTYAVEVAGTRRTCPRRALAQLTYSQRRWAEVTSQGQDGADADRRTGSDRFSLVPSIAHGRSAHCLDQKKVYARYARLGRFPNAEGHRLRRRTDGTRRRGRFTGFFGALDGGC